MRRIRLPALPETIRTSPVLEASGQAFRRGRREFKTWRLRRRRARVAKRKASKGRTTYVLAATLILLLGTFAWTVDYLAPSARGTQISVAELSALATQERIETAHFFDEDAIIIGEFSAPDPDAVDDAQARESDDEATSSKDAKIDNGAKGKGAKGNQVGDEDIANGGPSANTSAGDPSDETGGSSLAPDVLSADNKVAAPAGAGTYWLTIPSNGALTPLLTEMVTSAGADVDFDAQTPKKAALMVGTFLLPLMILANLFALLFTAGKGSSSGIGEVITFGSMGGKGARKKGKGQSVVNFSQVAGADEAVAELKEVVDYLKDPERYEDIGATPPKGVLLFGPPGCGKTLLAKAVAGEAGVPFFSVAGAEFVESLVGVGAARVRDLFQSVRAVAPAIVFIDELDAAGRKRGQGGGGGGSDEREQTLNQILVEMDGFEVSAGIVIMGATNRPDILDPALLRPGRFDRHITMEQPDMAGRQLILELHSANKPIAPTVDFMYLARRTPGFSGADLANVVNEAALLTVREGKPDIELPELEEAIQRVLAGPKKRGRLLSPEERKRAAFHESGHAIVAAASGRLDQVHRVSILARGRGIGMTNVQQASEAVLLTRDQLNSQLVTAMGGLASEELVFGVPSTGAEQDLEQATDLARDMIGRFGMGSRRRRLLTKEGEAFLGDELAVGQISAKTHQEMENEIDGLLEQAEQEARRVLEQYREVLDMLAGRLEREETLEGTDLESVLALVRPEVTLFGGIMDSSNRDNGQPEHSPLGL